MSISASAPTINAKEVEFFRQFSASWWDEKNGPKILHSMCKIMVPLVEDSLINTGLVKKELVDSPIPLQDMIILEVGCGGGILAEPLARTGSTVVGLDIIPELIAVAKQHAALDSSLKKLTYLLESVEDHAINNFEKYDAVIASDVIEHVDEQKTFLNACAKCLKPGGSIFIATLNKTTAAWLGGIILAENILRIVRHGSHDWNKFISPEEVQRILENSNCKTREVRGLLLNVFKNTWFWIKSTSVCYALHAVKDVETNI